MEPETERLVQARANDLSADERMENSIKVLREGVPMPPATDTMTDRNQSVTPPRKKAKGRRVPLRRPVGYTISISPDEHAHIIRIASRTGNTKEKVAQTAVRAYLMSGGLVDEQGNNVQSQEGQ